MMHSVLMCMPFLIKFVLLLHHCGWTVPPLFCSAFAKITNTAMKRSHTEKTPVSSWDKKTLMRQTDWWLEGKRQIFSRFISLSLLLSYFLVPVWTRDCIRTLFQIETDKWSSSLFVMCCLSNVLYFWLSPAFPLCSLSSYLHHVLPR